MPDKISRKMIAAGYAAVIALLCATPLLSQQASAPPPSLAAIEFPALMRQNLVAGKTPVGTQIEARLAIATLENGTVIPKDAVLSGEVIESVAKSGSTPARLAVRMDSAQWKTGAVPIKVYLTAWYYPAPTMSPQNLAYGPTDAEHTPRKWNGEGPYYDPNSPAYQPLPGSDPNKNPKVPSSSDHRILMKNVESLRSRDGGVVLTSTHSNLKIDKSTTYVFAGSDLSPAN
ncbi:MAG TPA: hypothetical protein VK828_15940 [Terriglobales bacterium]|nr:hypothetical protein [Terriglobales bacterium]